MGIITGSIAKWLTLGSVICSAFMILLVMLFQIEAELKKLQADVAAGRADSLAVGDRGAHWQALRNNKARHVYCRDES